MTVDGSPLQVGASNGLDVLVPIFKDAVSHGTWGLVGLSLLLVGLLAYLFRKQATRAERILIIVLVFSGIGALSFQLGSVHTGGRCAEFSSSGKCLKYRIPVEMMDAGSETFRQYFFRDMPERQKLWALSQAAWLQRPLCLAQGKVVLGYQPSAYRSIHREQTALTVSARASTASDYPPGKC